MPAGLLACWLRCLAFCQLPLSQSAALLASANLPASVALSLCGGCWPRCLASLLAGWLVALLFCRFVGFAACALVYWAIAARPFFLSAFLWCVVSGGHIAAVPVIVPPPPFMFTFFFFYRPSSYSVFHLDILMFAFVYSSIVYILFMFAFVYSSVAYILLMFAFVYSFIVDILLVFVVVLLSSHLFRFLSIVIFFRFSPVLEIFLL